MFNQLKKPSAEELIQINQFLPTEWPPVDQEDVAILTFIATDNLVGRSLAKWDIKDLEILSNKLPGLPLTLDHDWENVGKSQGLIYQSQVLISSTAPESIVSAAGNQELNRQIIASEGYQAIHCKVCFPIESQVLFGLRYGFLKNVSLGMFKYTDHVCPLCKISFSNDACPHYIPNANQMFSKDMKIKDVAPYYVRTGVVDLGELSLVLIPNMPGATTLQRRNII